MKNATYFTPSEMELFNSQNPIFDENQMKIINRKTPKSEIEYKVDKNNNKYMSVKAPYIKALVMLVTGGNYDFEIKSKEYIKESTEVLVEGRLTINSQGVAYSREQFGGMNVNTVRKEANTSRSMIAPVDLASAYKAAATEAFKKCASEFGFCWDIYTQSTPEAKIEAPEAVLSYSEQKILDRLVGFLKGLKDKVNIVATYTQFVDSTTDASDELLAQAEAAYKLNLERLK